MPLDFTPTEWETVATSFDENKQAASPCFLTIIPQRSKINPETNKPKDYSYGCYVCLEHFRGTQATRLVIMDEKTGLNVETIHLPTTDKFTVSLVKKSGNTTSMAYEVTIDCGPDADGCHELMILTMPYTGEADGPPSLMWKAIEHASAIVAASVDYLVDKYKKEAKKRAKKAAKEAARRRESYMSIDSP